MTTRPEFSHVILLEDIPPEGLTVELSANDQERAALARRFDLLTLDGLGGRMVLHPLSPGGVFLQGRLDAALSQACVVSGEPVPAQITEDFTISFVGELDEEEEGDSLLLEAEGEDIEPLEGDNLDLGEILAQQLALALDPYPRAPDQKTEDGPRQWSSGPKTAENDLDSEKKRPFDVLKQLRDKA